MTRVPLPPLVALALVLGFGVHHAAAALPSADPARTCIEAAPALLIVDNRTTCPILLYIDGEFVAECVPFMQQRIWCRRTGDVTAVARFACDSWGPRKLLLRPGTVTRWVIRESERGPKP